LIHHHHHVILQGLIIKILPPEILNITVADETLSAASLGAAVR
jgi:hypothetical protein